MSDKKVRILADQFPENPRNWDNLGTMAYKHNRYQLGDEEMGDPIDWFEEMLGLEPQGVYGNARLESLQNRFMQEFVALPLYLYDHSGITIQTTPFGCRWDSGQVGYIYVTKERLKAEYGWDRITTKRREQVERYLQAEVQTFDHYIRGDVYSFEVEGADGEFEDSCGGFFGTDWETNGIKDHIDEELWPQLEEVEIEY